MGAPGWSPSPRPTRPGTCLQSRTTDTPAPAAPPAGAKGAQPCMHSMQDNMKNEITTCRGTLHAGHTSNKWAGLGAMQPRPLQASCMHGSSKLCGGGRACSRSLASALADACSWRSASSAKRLPSWWVFSAQKAAPARAAWRPRWRRPAAGAAPAAPSVYHLGGCFQHRRPHLLAQLVVRAGGGLQLAQRQQRRASTILVGVFSTEGRTCSRSLASALAETCSWRSASSAMLSTEKREWSRKATASLRCCVMVRPGVGWLNSATSMFRMRRPSR